MRRFSGVAFILVMTTGCMTHPERGPKDTVVTETYVHRYGVEVTPDDWSSRGESGKVSSTLANGVVVSKTYDNGILEGETTYTFPHQSAIEKVEVYKQNELTQETLNYPSGAPQKQIQHRSPTNKITYRWYENGTPLSSEEYDSGLLVSGQYYSPDHQEESTVTNKQGVRTHRDNYGILEWKDTIQEGQLVSRTTFHPNNAPKAITPYVNGKIDGTRKTFLPGGEPNTIETWVAGVRQGETIVFVNGEKFAVIPFVNGKKQGTEQHFKDGIVLVEEINWSDDQRHGPTVSYLDGAVTNDYYWQGEPVSKTKFDVMSAGQ